MNIYFRKIGQVTRTIPPEPRGLYSWEYTPYLPAYIVGYPVLSGGKKFYPVVKGERIIDYFARSKAAKAKCDKANVEVRRRNKEITKIRDLEIKNNNKKINDWDKKYGDKS